MRRRDTRTQAGGTVPLPRLADLSPGTLVGPYRLEEVVGRGGMGVVYRGRHAQLERPAALKVLPPELALDDAFRERFLRESRIAASLQHPNVVVVYDAGEADGILYIAMQLVDGTDLGEVLRREGPLEPDRAVEILAQIGSALDAAHRLGLVHRDVKPANILLDDERAYLTDFGLTKDSSSGAALTVHGAFVGTVDYVAPEQIEAQALDGRTDLYALACVLFHMLAGSPPFRRDSEVSVVFAHVRDVPPRLSAVRSDLPAGLDDVFARALAKLKEDRFASCGELVAAARAALGGAGAAATGAAPAAWRTVVVSDPDVGIRALCRLTLEPEGFRVLETDSARGAVELAESRIVELVLVDSVLADETVARALRATGAKVLVMASRAAGADRASGGSAPGEGRLEKPFSGLQLVYRVEDLVGPGG